MTRNFFTILAGLMAFTICFGQSKYEPQILILSPNTMTYDKVFEKEIARCNEEAMKYQDAERESGSEMQSQPENIKLMMQSEIAFSKTLDFSKQGSLIAEQYLAYRFYEKFTNLLIILKDIKSDGKTADLKNIASEHKLQYVLNFPKINFYKDEGISKSKIDVQLYDRTSETLLLSKNYIGDWYNPGFEFACHDSSLECTLNNALSQALSDVIEIVAKNSPMLQHENMLAQQRFNILMNEYYLKPYDINFINNIISSGDSTINRHSLYQCLVDESKTKFIAFYLEKSKPHDFKSLNDKKDMNVNIISDKNIKDPGFLNDIPQMYAYVVKGVKYKNKWVYKKSNATYFEVKDTEDGKQKFFNNLQEWNFFKENSTDFNPDFWKKFSFE